MYRLSSLLVASCAMLSIFALPSICSPSSSSTSFVVAAPSNALLRDSARLAEQLNRILSEINSVLDSEDQNEDDEVQEELADEQEIQQSASEDPLEDLTEGDQIIGTINDAEVERPWWRLSRKKKSAEEIAAKKEASAAKKQANAEEFEQSRQAVLSGLGKAGRGVGRAVVVNPLAKGHQYAGKLHRFAKSYLTKEGRAARKLKTDELKVRIPPVDEQEEERQLARQNSRQETEVPPQP